MGTLVDRNAVSWVYHGFPPLARLPVQRYSSKHLVGQDSLCPRVGQGQSQPVGVPTFLTAFISQLFAAFSY